MVAALSALNAMSIDIMLPALPELGADFELANPNDRQFVVTLYLAVFGVSQLVYGPLTDALGRRVVLLGAIAIYIVGATLCVLAPNFELFLAARTLQGLGAGATRVVSMAVVRDMTEGRRMAQVMSMAMTVFMIVPIVAPTLGQLILFAGPWRWIFAALLIYSSGVFVWALLRLPETLRPENATPLRLRRVAGAYLSILRERQFVGYAAATTFISAALMAYITASEQLFVEVYKLGAAFPLAFAVVAVVMSAATFVNSRIVMRHGMRRISHAMLLAFTAFAAILAGIIAIGAASFWIFLTLLCATLGLFGLIAGNFNALAMEPLGRVAGTASALYGAVTGTGAALLATLIAHQFNGTALPFALGMLVCGVLCLGVVLLTERGRLFSAA
jgi:MFS transporter, DHA1 family, multidrug resistance protein